MRWEEMTAPDIGALDREHTIVLLPLGSVEQHGHHMPVGTDSILAHSVCLSASARRDGTIVLPPPWYGFSAHHMAFAGTVTLPAPTLIAVGEAIVESVIGHGFRRVAIINGHGGNGGVTSVLASTLGHRFHGKARVVALTYFQLARDAIAELRQTRPGGMGHACEFETAMMLHHRPDLVQMERSVTLYPDPGSRYLTTDLLGAAPVSTFLDFNDLSPSGTLGDPSLATAETGARFFAAATDALVHFLDDFASWPVDMRRRDA